MEGTVVRFFDEIDHLTQFRTGVIRFMSEGYYNAFNSDRAASYKTEMQIEAAVKEGTVDKYAGMKFVGHPEANGKSEYRFKNATVKFHAPVEYYAYYDEESFLHQKVSCYTLVERPPSDSRIEPLLDKRAFQFRKYYCLITSLSDFQKRIATYCTAAGIDFQTGLVRYALDDDYTGLIDSSVKYDQHHWQNEWRILLTVAANDPYFVNIGDISDITLWGTVVDLQQGEIRKDRWFIPNISSSIDYSMYK